MTDLVRTFAHTISGKPEATTTLIGSFGDEETAETARARLNLDLRGQIKLAYQGTMTQAEVTETVLELARRFGARSQCHLIIRSIPDEVIPTVLPQLREMAEYEVRMWQLRQDEIQGSEISERWISLPVTPA